MIKEIEVGGVKHSITLADDMVGQGLMKDENGVVSVDVENLGINEEKLVKTTWAELKALRDEAKLNAGTFYRITDYVTTTTQSETKSANHPFDVIVLALSENTISEDAKAALHEDDTYFADSDLSAWELKYCLDNDSTRFAWADKTNGKGVIYRMVDENRNDCPYDFKNILFYNTTLITVTTSDKYYYTFSYIEDGVLYDGTTKKQVGGYYDNVMGEYHVFGVLQLNSNVFRICNSFHACRSNTFGNNCNDNTFSYECSYNKFGDYCYSNTFGDTCSDNTFGFMCHDNTFQNSCNHNNFGNYCSHNRTNNFCNNNTFGNTCKYNTLVGYSKYNTLGGDSNNRTLDSNKTSLTHNEEFYDDGSGQLVPTKHPDLSTQPSILPYKFMGQYVYEQMIPVNVDLIKEPTYKINWPDCNVDKPLILEGCEIIYGLTITPDRKKYPLSRIYTVNSISCEGFEYDGVTSYGSTNIRVAQDAMGTSPLTINKAYLKIVYTSMPEEGDYYGYNNY